jgi:uncharacterized protein YfaT (DUF1175 family)
MRHIQRKLTHIEAREDCGMIILNIRLVTNVKGDVIPVDILSSVPGDLINFSRSVEDYHLQVAANALWAALRNK